MAVAQAAAAVPKTRSNGNKGKSQRCVWVSLTSLVVKSALIVDCAQSLSNHWDLYRPPPQALFRRRRACHLAPGPLSMSHEGREAIAASLKESDEDDDDFCQIVDSFGCEAFEKLTKSESDDDLQWIRVEKEPDPSIVGIRSKDDVLRKIKDVKRQQGCMAPCELYPRRWSVAAHQEELNEPVNGVDRAAEREFSVAQFNTLAEGLSCGSSAKTPFTVKSRDPKATNEKEKASFGGFSSIPFPKVALDFSLRRWRLLEVILGGDQDSVFDLVAMEEVDRYHGFFSPLLRLFGYQGRFVPKTRAPGLSMGWYSDGCALFWRPTFEFVSEQRREYSVGNQVYMIVTLRHVATGHHVIAAVTHLKAQKGAAQEKVRCHQVDELLDSVSKRARVLLERHKAVSVLVMGDFNADPPVDEKDDGAVARVLSREIQARPGSARSPIRSAYDLTSSTLYTTWKTRGTDTTRRIIDYIFFSGSLTCRSTLNVPSEEELDATKLPGLRYPSDHMMIAAKFRIELS